MHYLVSNFSFTSRVVRLLTLGLVTLLFASHAFANADYVCIQSTAPGNGQCTDGAWGAWNAQGCRTYTGVTKTTGTWIWGNTREGCSGRRMFGGQLQNGTVTGATIQNAQGGVTLGNTRFNANGTFESTANSACTRQQCDTTAPTCTTTIDWDGEPLTNSVGTCNDGGGSGCVATTYTTIPFNLNNQPQSVRACDVAGNCATCAPPPVDNTPPNCTSKINWTDKPLDIEVDTCTDDVSGCKPATYTGRNFDKNDQPRGADACDKAGNCRECDPITEIDRTPPDCVATFEHPDRWHNGADFETNPPLRCWLESCTDAAANGEVASGCLNFPVNNETVTVFNDPNGETPVVNVENEALQPQNEDTCKIEVCDNAGWCNTCESPALKFDDTEVCSAGTGLGKSADGVCGPCDPDDDDCLCIKGDASKCRDGGPINCYTNPFHDRCPGFQNPACLIDPFTPGCPVVNPCYPTEVYDGVVCPRDAIRFCSRNPYHYGCNASCDSGAINCNPAPPGDTNTGGDQCGLIGLPGCAAYETGADGCDIAVCTACVAGFELAADPSQGCEAIGGDQCGLIGLPGCAAYETGTDGCPTNSCTACIDGFQLLGDPTQGCEAVVQETNISLQHAPTQPSVVIPSAAALTEVYRFNLSADAAGPVDLGRITLDLDLNGIEFDGVGTEFLVRSVASGVVDQNSQFPVVVWETGSNVNAVIDAGEASARLGVDLSGQRLSAGLTLTYALFIPSTVEVGDAENSDGLTVTFLTDDQLQVSVDKATLEAADAKIIWSGESDPNHSDTTLDWQNGFEANIDLTPKRLTK